MRILAILCLLLAAQPAFAHAMLEQASPSAGAVLSAAPKEIVLEYSEPLEPAFSNAEVRDSEGASVVARTEISGKTIHVVLKPLAPGLYRVIWHAVSVDTHRTQGAYSFTVKP